MYQLTFVLNFLTVVFLMKLLSAYFYYKQTKFWPQNFWLYSPLLTLRSIQKHSVKNFKRSKIFINLAINILIFGLWIILYAYFFPTENTWISRIILSPSIYFLTQIMCQSAQLLFSTKNIIPFDIHSHPYLSTSLTDFWSRRWNRWAKDWLSYIALSVKQFKKNHALWLAFIFSGIFHELMFNIPYFIFKKKSYFGTMMIYFLIQALGYSVQKKYLRTSPTIINRIWTWIIIFIPSPLFISPPFLYFVGLSHE